MRTFSPLFAVHAFESLPNDTIVVCMKVMIDERTVGEDNLRDQETSNDDKTSDDEETSQDAEKSSDTGVKVEETNQGTSDAKNGQEGNSDEEEDNSEVSVVLVQYNLNGDKLFEKMLDELPNDMRNVTLGNSMCLALSSRWV